MQEKKKNVSVKNVQRHFHNYMRLRDTYKNEIIPRLKEELGYNNPHALPKIEKVVLNMGVGRAVKNKKEITEAQKDLTLIAGQKAIITHARKSIAGFSLGKGASIGVKVTLRGDRMYAFLDKLFNIVLPRTRDFQGLSLKSFDGSGNYSIGMAEQSVFPEIDPNTLDQRRGLQVVIVTSANTNEECKALLLAAGLPLEKID